MARTPSSHDWHVQPVVKDRFAFRLSGALSVPTGPKAGGPRNSFLLARVLHVPHGAPRAQERFRAHLIQGAKRRKRVQAVKRSLEVFQPFGELVSWETSPNFQPRGRGNFVTALLYQMSREPAKTQNPSLLMPRLSCRYLLYQASPDCASTRIYCTNPGAARVGRRTLRRQYSQSSLRDSRAFGPSCPALRRKAACAGPFSIVPSGQGLACLGVPSCPSWLASFRRSHEGGPQRNCRVMKRTGLSPLTSRWVMPAGT